MDDEKVTVRVGFLKALCLIASSINDEEVFDYWLMLGVPDGSSEEDLPEYCDDDSMKSIMSAFLTVMREASKSGGLYFDGLTA